jgi:cell division protein FtsN
VTTLSADSLSRVRVGPFAARAEAVAKLKALEAKGHHGFVIADAHD